MNNVLITLVGCFLISTSVSASSPLDSFTREELIDRLTSVIPIKDNLYSCEQVIYNYNLSKKAINSCGFSRLSSAADTGSTMCNSWAMLKSDGSFVKIRSIAKKAERDFDEKYSSSLKKDAICSRVFTTYSDFIVK